MARSIAITKRQNWVLGSLYFCLVAIGTLLVYSSMINQQTLEDGVRFPPEFLRYLIYLGIAIGCFFMVNLIDWKFWYTGNFIFYLIGILSLILVLLVGSKINGARSWLSFAGFTIQVGEFAKITTAICLSSYLSYFKTDLNTSRSRLVCLGIILLPSLLILLQPDAGTVIIYLSLTVVLMLAGFPLPIFFFIASVLALFIISELSSTVYASLLLLVILNILQCLRQKKRRHQLQLLGATISATAAVWIIFTAQQALILSLVILCFWIIRDLVLKKYRRPLQILAVVVILGGSLYGTSFLVNNVLESHQRERIDVWLNPERCNPLGSMYNLIQSKNAIGSGRFLGKGYLDGTLTHLDYVPEQGTDFIFTILGEEQGFLGSFALIVLFFFLIYRLTLLAERWKNPFNRYFTYCVAVYLLFHVFINIGMTMGIMPVVGIPLPFISKGGSSLIAFSIMVGIINSLQYRRES